MITKLIADYSSRGMILLILITYFLPNFSSIDRIGNQWLYLSIINLIGIILIFFKHNADFKLFYFKEISALKWYFLFIVTSLISFFVSENISESIFTFNQYFNCLLAFYLIFFFLSDIKSREKFVIQVLFTLLLFELYFSFIPILKDISSGNLSYRGMRYSGLAANINVTSFSLVFKLPILLYLISTVKKVYKKIILSILLIPSLYTVFMLGTRGAFLGLIICFGLYIIYLIINYKTIKNNLSGLLLIILSVILSVIFNLNSSTKGKNNSVIDRASSISISTTDGSVNQRLRYYKQGLTQFLKTPLLGVGIGNWKLISIEYDKEDIKGYTVPYHAHNDFIQILSEQGVIGFVSYLMVFVSFIFIILKRKLIYTNKVYIFLTASFLVFFLDSNLNFPIARPISHLQFLLVLALVSTNQKGLNNEK
tara:strand:+ start:17 stop:1288 length:1272 start_codon:yes stop_codon:yes gene_type:complete